MAKKILLIDDDLVTVKLLKNRLKNKGYDVLAAMDGEEGIKAVKDTKPDLIILDVLMPKAFGSDVAKALKQDVQTKDIPIIFLSNVPSQFLSGEERKTGKVEQVVDGQIFLSKLCNAEELLGAIKKALG